MSDSLRQVGLNIAEALLRVGRHLGDPADVDAFLRELGFEVPQPVDLGAVADGLGAVLDTIDALEALGEADGRSARLQSVVGLLRGVAGAHAAIDGLAALLDAQLPAAFLAASEIGQRLPRRLLDWAIVEDVRWRWPVAYRLLVLLGLLEVRRLDADPARFQPAFVERVVHWDRLLRVIGDPTGLVSERYDWGNPAFAVDTLLGDLQELAWALAIPADGVEPSRAGPGPISFGPAVAGRFLQVPILGDGHGGQLLTVRLAPLDPAWAGGLPGLGISLRWGLAIATEVEITRGLRVSFQAASAQAGGIEIALRPDAEPQVTLAGTPGAPEGRQFALGVIASTGHGPATLLAIDEDVRVEVREIGLELGARVSPAGHWDLSGELALRDATVLISTSNTDAFLARIMPGDGVKARFSLALGWSSARGVYLGGSGGLETTIGVHKTIGPFEFRTLHLGLAASGPALNLEVSISGGATLGPLAVSVERLGASVALRFEAGNVGPANLDIDFKPPTGLGIVLDAGVITGGGFLSFDAPNHRYAGVLQVEMLGISASAIGLLDTVLPGGEAGFSFLIIVAAELPPIQVGFGFSLNGVGGLAGIHRTVVTEALQAGVRNGAVDGIMFPVDPVRNALQIISDLRAIFPPARDQYVFGPMLKLGWGGSLIEAEVGIILELPAPVRLILLGQLNVELPSEDAPVVELHVDVVGIIDFGQRFLSIDASLHDSHVGFFAVYGDLALRLSWGDPPSFALSIGGLNPHFQPPPGFPDLRRVTAALGLGDEVRIGLQGYLAVTSNSLQFGALAELYAAAGPVSVYGWIGFDVLFFFSPFSFRADFTAGFLLRWDDEAIAGVQVTGMLAGPAPWRARGEACITILFFDICVSFDVTVGEERHQELPPADPWPPLLAALENPLSWSAALPPLSQPVVSITAPLVRPAPVLVHPQGTVSVHQRVVPLNRTLTKFGEAPPAPVNRFDVSSVTAGTVPAPGVTVLQDYFAPGQFLELSDAEKLSRPSFEKMDAGLTLASAAVALGAVTGLDLRYETVIIDSPWSRRPDQDFSPSLRHQLAMELVGASAKAQYFAAGLRKFWPEPGPPDTSFGDEDHTVVDVTDLGARPDIAEHTTRVAAEEALAAHMVAHPEDAGRFEVMPDHEVAGRP